MVRYRLFKGTKCNLITLLVKIYTILTCRKWTNWFKARLARSRWSWKSLHVLFLELLEKPVKRAQALQIRPQSSFRKAVNPQDNTANWGMLSHSKKSNLPNPWLGAWLVLRSQQACLMARTEVHRLALTIRILQSQALQIWIPIRIMLIYRMRDTYSNTTST